MREPTYQLWALGYAADDSATDNAIFLGQGNPEELREHALRFKDTSYLPDPGNKELILEEGEFFTLCIETVRFENLCCEDYEEETTDREDLFNIYQPEDE